MLKIGLSIWEFPENAIKIVGNTHTTNGEVRQFLRLVRDPKSQAAIGIEGSINDIASLAFNDHLASIMRLYSLRDPHGHVILVSIENVLERFGLDEDRLRIADLLSSRLQKQYGEYEKLKLLLYALPGGITGLDVISVLSRALQNMGGFKGMVIRDRSIDR